LIPLSDEPASRDGLLLTIQGRTVLDWTVDAMRRISEICDVVIAQPAANRLATLRQALDSAPPSDRILFHEPNRPLTSAAGLRSFLHDAGAHQAAAMVVPVKSTYKEVVDGRVRGDEFALCQSAGIPIQLIPGSFFNFPIAARTDAEFAEMAMLQGLRLAP
jgi:2-C-methyl-D-erythritol 4-phosphate cytidylyltransferase